MKKNNYPIELSKHPNWPIEMKCKECGFKGWQWMGITKLLFNMYQSEYSIKKCNGCGVGVLRTSENGAMPVFILKS